MTPTPPPATVAHYAVTAVSGEVRRVSGRVLSTDRFEAQLYIEGQARPFVLVFSTLTTVQGVRQPNTTRTFWQNLSLGDFATIKSEDRGYFHLIRAINIRNGAN